jgi:hypothetical protein
MAERRIHVLFKRNKKRRRGGKPERIQLQCP